MQKYALRLATVGLASLLIAACADKPQSESEQDVSEIIKQGVWSIEFVEKRPVLSAPTRPNYAHLRFGDDNKVTGADGCNRLSGEYSLGEKSIGFSRVATTMMACQDQTAAADSIGVAMGKVTNYRLLQNHLLLIDDSGAIIMQLMNRQETQ